MTFGIFGGARMGRADTLHDNHSYRNFIDYPFAAGRIGFEAIFLVEHYVTGQGRLSSSLNLRSYLAARTNRIRRSASPEAARRASNSSPAGTPT